MNDRKKIVYIGNALSKHGLTPTTIETLSQRLSVDFNMVVSSSKKNKLARVCDMLWTLWIHRKTADHVLIDTYSSQAFWFSYLCARLAKRLSIPYTAFLHGGSLPTRYKTTPKSSRLLLSDAQSVVAPSGYLKDATETVFGISVKIIPNYLDLDLYPFVQRQELKPLRLLWVRSFHQIYRPEWAVEIVAYLKENNVEATLTMVGPDKDGTLQACKEHAARLNLTDSIAFTGRLPKTEWIARAAQHNVFLNTTSADNTPVSVMEAMALGLPVVTTKVGGIPFLFEDGVEGIMVENADASTLAEAILSLKSNPEKTTAISLAARKKAEQWDWTIVHKQWKTLFGV